MKLCVLALVILVLPLLAFLHFHSKSIDRALLLNMRSDLLGAQRELRQHGSFTNSGRSVYVCNFTNPVTIGGVTFSPELAAHRDGWTNFGYLAITKDGIFLWFDNKWGPMVVAGGGHPHLVPPRFRDF